MLLFLQVPDAVTVKNSDSTRSPNESPKVLLGCAIQHTLNTVSVVVTTNSKTVVSHITTSGTPTVDRISYIEAQGRLLLTIKLNVYLS